MNNKRKFWKPPTEAELARIDAERRALREAQGLPVRDLPMIEQARRETDMYVREGVHTRDEALAFLRAYAIREASVVGDVMWRAIRLATEPAIERGN